jgi:uncharacterized protein (TIGR02145 family)
MKRNNRIQIYLFTVIGFVLILASSCKDKEKTVPVLTTSVVTGITSISASCGGNITDGCSVIYARGLCWSIGTNPSISDCKTADGTCDNFTSAMTGLTPNTTYYVRAYATNDVGTGYGNILSFTTQQGNTITDVDGNIYNTIVIGTQTWMLENLKVTKYRNSDAIPNDTNSAEWITLTSGAYCNYNNDVNNSTTYGRLYNWFAVNDIRNIAPVGWHIATANDWETLINYLGGKESAGGKMKEAGLAHWISPNMDADNSSGFTALPGGNRFSDGTFGHLGQNCFFWSATEKDTSTAFARQLGTDHMDCDLDSLYKVDGLSVRCLKD